MAFPYSFPAYPYQMYQPLPVSQPVNPQTGIIWVSGENEAQMYPVAPNNAVALWDSSAPVLYLKQADASGKPGMKIYDLTERAVSVSGSGGISVPTYATKDDLVQFNSAIEQMKADIEKLKRRPTRRTEDDE